ncbi:mannonate dehydratase [Poriferisphaera sp. WC338]|uniref:mannonate dehydratase n=1 Tax=Poriferisphaera sp. WC338 TaxID=3425129 RepID=UPI003D8143DE
MKLGLGLYRHQLNTDHFRFAKQIGATHVIVHLVDYFNQGNAGNPKGNQPTGDSSGWGVAIPDDELWTVSALQDLKAAIEKEGLVLEAIENFDPGHWGDVLLDGPRKQEQLQHIKRIIECVGQAGIPIFGYNFSLAGVCSRTTGPYARGQAVSVAMSEVDETPIPKGMVWNMIVDPDNLDEPHPEITHDQLWSRLQTFLKTVIPTAEASGVRLAAHPDDPPAPFVRKSPRLVYQPQMYQRLLDLVPSSSNALEFCLGSLAEMTEGDLYEMTQSYAERNAIAYIHFRNVSGKVPHYRETFVDDGDINMRRILQILKASNFDGVMIPDHTPQVTCDAPWHAGMSHALGYMKGLLDSLQC